MSCYGLFLYPVKILENHIFFVVFRRYRKRRVAWNWLTKKSLPLKLSENLLMISRGKRSYLTYLNSYNIRSKIWRQSLRKRSPSKSLWRKRTDESILLEQIDLMNSYNLISNGFTQIFNFFSYWDIFLIVVLLVCIVIS